MFLLNDYSLDFIFNTINLKLKTLFNKRTNTRTNNMNNNSLDFIFNIINLKTLFNKRINTQTNNMNNNNIKKIN